jgi:hypothetical protein
MQDAQATTTKSIAVRMTAMELRMRMMRRAESLAAMIVALAAMAKEVASEAEKREMGMESCPDARRAAI